MTHPDTLAERQANARNQATETILALTNGSGEATEVLKRLAGYQVNGTGGPGTHVESDLIAALADVVAAQGERIAELEAKPAGTRASTRKK